MVLKLKQLLIFNNDTGFQVTEDRGESIWFALQDPAAEENSSILIISLQLLRLLWSLLFSLYLIPHSCLSPCTFLLRDHCIHRKLQSMGCKNFVSPGFISQNISSFHKPGPHKAIKSSGSLGHLETTQTNWFFFSSLSQMSV